jgi:hypothetical protein
MTNLDFACYRSHCAIHSPLPTSSHLSSIDLGLFYPKNPKNLGERFRKWRMEQGVLIREFASKLGVTEDTVINWEIRGMAPRHRSNMQRLSETIPGLGRFLRCGVHS